MATEDERAALTEIVRDIEAALQANRPIAEGIRHELEATDLSGEARTAVSQNLSVFDQRTAALTARRTTIESVLADGYPDLYEPIQAQTVSAAILAELQQNLSSQQQAIGQYQVEPEATGGTFTLGVAEPKP